MDGLTAGGRPRCMHCAGYWGRGCSGTLKLVLVGPVELGSSVGCPSATSVVNKDLKGVEVIINDAQGMLWKG